MTDMLIIPARVTARYPTFRSGRNEAWEAKSLDGDWDFERIEDTGTPWLATHVPSGHTSLHSSLRKARQQAGRQLGLDVGIGIWSLLGRPRSGPPARIHVL